MTLGKSIFPFTRVHNIFRIRTIVNATSSMNNKGVFPNDRKIATVLAKSGLSKFRREKIKDRIMRRARDHLLTATYMGLLSRKNHPFEYSSTKIGKLLEKYPHDAECPKDSWEESIFIDRLMRLKLTNTFDLQFRTRMPNYRSRPCLFILYLLKSLNSLHQHHIAIGTGGIRSDPFLMGSEEKNTIKKLKKYRKQPISKFYTGFRINKKDRKNLTRNIRPLLDWLTSTNLIEKKSMKQPEYYKITERGKTILSIYSKKIPVWYIDFKDMKEIKSAVLLFYSFLLQFGIQVNESFIKTPLQIGLTTIPLKKIIQQMENETGIKFQPKYSSLKHDVDFMFEYDVLPSAQRECLIYLKKIFNIAHLKFDISKIDDENLKQLVKIIEENNVLIAQNLQNKFSKSTSLKQPLLKKLAKMTPTGGVLNQYKSDFEKEVSIFLRLLQLNAMKYQGQLSYRTHKRHVIAFFENNPDILISNGIESLIECKSVGEWKMPIRNMKSVPKEILIYQQYLPEVGSCSAVIVYEGTLDQKSIDMIESILDDAPQIVFITKNFLINCIQKPQEKKRLIQTIQIPKKYKSLDRILG